MKVIEHVYQDAVIEAAQSHNAYILEKDKHDAIKSKQSLTVCNLVKQLILYFVFD